MGDFKEDTDNNTVIIKDFNTTLSSMDRSSIQKKNNKDIMVLNKTLDQMV